MAAWQCNPDTNIHSLKISYIKLRTQILVIPGVALMKVFSRTAEFFGAAKLYRIFRDAEGWFSHYEISSSVHSLIVLSWQIQLIVDK